MPVSNPLRKFVKKVNQYPSWLSRRLLTWMFQFKVKLTRTARLEILHTDLQQVTFRIRNRKKVQNHIGSVHAAAMALLAESATGFLVGVNLPGDKLPLIKTMTLNYTKRASGDMLATASLSTAQIAQMKTLDKGDITVDVRVTDENNIEPVICTMVWAWVPKRKPAQA
jgi:acyl-coenzyme A thioesterase PaaI-like protein